MVLRNLLLLFSLVGCGLCWRQLVDFPDVRDEWPIMPNPGMEVARDAASPLVCDICEVVIDEVQSLLGNDSQQIIDLLDKVCALLPPDYNATCKEYVDEWTPIIIDFLENQTPEEVCQDLTLCSAAVAARPETRRFSFGHLIRNLHKTLKKNFNKLMIRNALGNGFLCNGCNEVVTLLHNALTSEPRLDEIAALLGEGCVLCPVEEQCLSFFEALPGKIIAEVDAFLNNQTCKNIGLCTSSGYDNPFDMLIRLFPDFLPEDFDRDMIPGRPMSRPNTDPWSRRNPGGPRWSRPTGVHRRNHTSVKPGMGRPDHGHPHERPHRPQPHPHRPQPHPHRPHHHDHPLPGGFHPQPQHPWDTDMPQPGGRHWWKPGMKPGMKPFRPRPGGDMPTLPEEPMIPEVEVPEVEVPEVEVPEVDVPEVEKPALETPIADEIRRDMISPGSSPIRKGLDRWVKPVLPIGRGAGASPGKHAWPGNRKRRQRSLRIHTFINTFKDFAKAEAETFDVEPANGIMDQLAPTEAAVETTWQCDACEYEVEILVNYIKENKLQEVLVEELLSLADLFCDRLPATKTAECKAEFADLVPPFIDSLIDTYLTPGAVCGALKVC